MNKLFAVLLLCGALGGGTLQAASLPLSAKPYPFITIDQDLRSALRSFAANVGVNIQLSDGVQGQVRGKLPKMSERRFFAFLVKSYALAYYYDGSVLFVYSAQELQNEIIPLEGASANLVIKALKDLHVYDARYPVRSSAYAGMLIVTGPTRYLELVEAVIAQLSPAGDGQVQTLTGASPAWRPGEGGAHTTLTPSASDLAM